MSIEPGRMLAHYRLQEKIGEGGMGAVWRAMDTTLDRDVAIKILPREFSIDAGRLARFEREAKVLASLNHPNIASIFGLHEVDDFHFLAMELVAGETLADRLARGPVPVDTVLELAIQVAEALEAAHEGGVVHRDLKPANIQVTTDGKVKVLDFGLAKSVESGTPPGDPSTSPTVTSGGTQAGVILGTAAYMSPEQARGRVVDRRTDIWSFGCVLFELLSGRRAYDGDTVSDTIAGILTREPDFDLLRAGTPTKLRDILRRCLRKDTRQRFHDIADVRVELEEVQGDPAEPTAAPATTGTARVLPWIVAAAASVLAIVALWMAGESSPPPRQVSRFTIDVPPDRALLASSHPAFALSADGRTLVYVGRHGESSRLYRRALDRDASEPIAGTEGAVYPFLSPDGQWIGFHHVEHLMKVPLSGGAPVELCESGDDIPGANWGAGDRIVFSHGFGEHLFEVPASGGSIRRVVPIDPAAGEGALMWPQILPGGRAALFTVFTLDTWDKARIMVASLDTGERREIARGGTYARYLPTGHLIYARAGTLVAVPFDIDKLEVAGDEVTVIPDLMMSASWGVPFLSISNDGTLAYLPGGERVQPRMVLRVDRRGNAERLFDDPLGAHWVDPSPDGRRLAITMTGAVFHIWILDLQSRSWNQFTFQGDNTAARWSPDGERLVFFSNMGRGYDVASKLADGSGGRTILVPASDLGLANMGSFSPDGKSLLLARGEAGSSQDIYVFAADSDPALRRLAETGSNDTDPQLSPDGRWLAYTSDSSGRREVYVASYPGLDRKSRISNGGGSKPRWRRDGRELFYVGQGTLYAAPVTTGDNFTSGEPVALFDRLRVAGTADDEPAEYALAPQRRASELAYGVFPDGQHFAWTVDEPDPAPQPLRVVLNWFEELRRLAPSGD